MATAATSVCLALMLHRDSLVHVLTPYAWMRTSGTASVSSPSQKMSTFSVSCQLSAGTNSQHHA